MPYIPEHRFQGDLYTNGGEYAILSTGKAYQGFYHKLSSGKSFTEKTPYTNITQELIPIGSTDTAGANAQFNRSLNPVRTIGDIIDLNPLNFSNNLIFNSLEQTSTYINTFQIDSNQSYLTPIPYLPLPTPEDYTNGTFIRYILFNTVSKNYLEVNQDTYNNISSRNSSWDYFPYIAFTLPWRLSGTKEEIIQTNTKMIVVVSRDNNLPSLSSYLVDLYEYSKLNKVEEPFTYTIIYRDI
tara:strand:+ start:4053 stop:4772 length:720 start_codon:yes stop_codon:yes gene_type:complete